LNIQTELEVEKRANAELRLIVNTQHAQMDDLSQQVKKIEAARIKDQEEIKKQQAVMNVKLIIFLGRVDWVKQPGFCYHHCFLYL
jgi:hypothetical protein